MLSIDLPADHEQDDREHRPAAHEGGDRVQAPPLELVRRDGVSAGLDRGLGRRAVAGWRGIALLDDRHMDLGRCSGIGSCRLDYWWDSWSAVDG